MPNHFKYIFFQIGMSFEWQFGFYVKKEVCALHFFKWYINFYEAYNSIYENVDLL